MSIGEALGIAALGIVVVMSVLAILAIFIKLLSKVVGAFSSKAAIAPPPPAVATVSAPPPAVLPEKQSAGKLVLVNTDEPTAAMLMAIVADNLQTPLNTLYFKSIKCLEEK